MNSLAGRKIVLGVTGGVAAYKAAELVRLLGKAGAEVHVVLTAAGAQFVSAITFQALSGNTVWTELWDPRMTGNMAHINLTRGADAVLIAPASADFMAKLTHGMADDLLSTLCLARDCPMLVAPAMNRQMWENPSTQRNVQQLRDDGVTLLGPASGVQACGEVGMGRMLEPEELLVAVEAFFASSTPATTRAQQCPSQPSPAALLAGRKVVLTAGPTYEAIDPVRGITNISSGKMGYALAAACAAAGAEVVLVSGPTRLDCPVGVRRVDVASAREMQAAVDEALPGAHVFIGVAAVADYRPAETATDKIKKSGTELVLRLVPNPDILAGVAARVDRPVCVGFAAESRDLAKYAQAKLHAKRLDMVVGNLVQDGMGGDDNTVIIFDHAGQHPLPRAAKEQVAAGIVAHLGHYLATAAPLAHSSLQ